MEWHERSKFLHQWRALIPTAISTGRLACLSRWRNSSARGWRGRWDRWRAVAIAASGPSPVALLLGRSLGLRLQRFTSPLSRQHCRQSLSSALRLRCSTCRRRAHLISPRSGVPKYMDSVRQQIHANAHQHRRRPPPPIHILFQEDLSGDRIRHQRERSRCRSHQAQVQVIQRKEQRKNATARKNTPAKNSGLVRTARSRPSAQIARESWSRSPIDFIAAAVSTSPVVEVSTTAAIIAAAAHAPGVTLREGKRHRVTASFIRFLRCTQQERAARSAMGPAPQIPRPA